MASRAEHGVCQDERRRLHLLKTPFSFLVSFLVDYLLGDRNLRPCCPRDLKYTRASQQSLYLLSFFILVIALSYFLFLFFTLTKCSHFFFAPFLLFTRPHWLFLIFSRPHCYLSPIRFLLKAGKDSRRKKQEFSRRGN